MKTVTVRIGVGEYVDRLTILELKLKHAAPANRAAIKSLLLAWELGEEGLEAISARHTDAGESLAAINAELWEIENKLREHEARSDFTRAFVLLARRVYTLNDKRAALKKHLNGGDLDPKIYTV